MKTISNSPLWKNRLQEKPGTETETLKKGFRETVDAALATETVFFQFLVLAFQFIGSFRNGFILISFEDNDSGEFFCKKNNF